jgi:hypothetical protein
MTCDQHAADRRIDDRQSDREFEFLLADDCGEGEIRIARQVRPPAIPDGVTNHPAGNEVLLVAARRP